MKQRHYKECKLGETTYGIYLLPALKGAIAAKKLSNIIAPVAGSILDAQTSTALDGMKFSTIGTIIMEHLDLIDLDWLLSSLGFFSGNLLINGNPCDQKTFDNHFMGNYGELIDVIAFVLKENFESAFLESTLGQKALDTVKGMFTPVNPPAEESEKSSDQE